MTPLRRTATNLIAAAHAGDLKLVAKVGLHRKALRLLFAGS